MHYFRVAVNGSAAPLLTYHSEIFIEIGTVVTVSVLERPKKATIVAEVAKPDFDTIEIAETAPYRYRPWQMETAKFVSEYYFCTFGEAIGLFLPYKEDNELGMRNEELGIKDVVPKRPKLTSEQLRAYEGLKEKETALLFGVTGSGKTEIFIARIADMLEAGKTAIMLMPEISLTPQMQKRLERYFGERVAIWHSKIAKKQKERILEAIEKGEVRVVAGARSALFVPMPDLGLIVVDEEHDDSYKSQSRPRYHARDLAVYIAKKRGAQTILASATPSVASYRKYPVVRLKTPYVRTKKDYRFVTGEGVVAPIVYAIREHFDAGDQGLLFLPTRGNFKYLYCPSCGKTHTCPYCSVGMALHRKKRYLKCHYCNYTEAIRERCAYCDSAPLLSERMGTQEAKEVIENTIEGIRVELFDSDTITTPKKLADALKRFEKRESDLLLGTQMLSKGHDYPGITLSVITGLDHIMGMADYRCREKAIGLLLQIAGRSGRAKEAEVVIQTGNAAAYEPYLDDYETFVKEELLFREIGRYPPFVSLARILVSHKKEEEAARIVSEKVAVLQRYEGIEIVGHGKAPIERIAGKYRYQILLRAPKRIDLLKALHAVASKEVEIDMDPVEFS